MSRQDARLVPMNERDERGVGLAVVAASAAILLWMMRALTWGAIPLNGDLLSFYYPVHDFYAQAIGRHQAFDWMPSLMGGVDLAGEGQLGGYHPLHWLLYKLVPLDTAFMLETVAGYPVAFAGTWLFLRRWTSAAPALFGAMLFAFCGFNFQHGVHPNMLAVIVHVPWLLWAIDAAFAAVSTRGRLAACGAIALLTGSQLLLGHPQAFWLSALIEAAFTFFLLKNGLSTASSGERAPTYRGSVWSAAAAAITGKLLGAGIGTIQLMATMHASARSTRAEFGPDFPFTYALPPLQLLQLLHPYFFWGRVQRWTDVPAAGDEFGVYAGAVTLTLAAWWLFQYRGLRRAGRCTPFDRLALWAVAVALFSWLMAVGRSGGIYYVQTWLPFVGMFRDAVRYVSLADFAVALASAAALAHLLGRADSNSPARVRALIAPWALAMLSVLTALLLAFRMDWSQSHDAQLPLSIVFGPMLFGAAAGLLTLAVHGRRGASIALVLLAAGDQALYGLGGVAAWHDFAPRSEAIALAIGPPSLLPPATGSRVICCQAPNVYGLAGYRLIDGYLGLIPKRLLNYRLAETLRIADVAYAHKSFVDRTHVAVAGQESPSWYRLAPPLPRARLLTRAQVSERPDLDVKTVDIDGVALVNHEITLAGGDPGTATIVRDEPGDIAVRTVSSTRQLLTVSESLDDGWRATVDGQGTAVERVNGDFLGALVPPGEHVVAFTFAPAYRSIGGPISLGAGIVALLLLSAGLRARRSASDGSRTSRGHNG